MTTNQRPRYLNSGVALVLVLAFLVLISGLILAFFSSVTTDANSAASFASEVTTKQLADTAANLVIGEITDATAGYQLEDPSNPKITAWASQPGMIRTYDDSGNPYRFYKLYSARNMVMTSLTGLNVNTEFDNDVPTTWYNQPGIYADLNAPALVPDATGSVTKNNTNYRAVYPIVDPLASSTFSPNSAVEGFTISSRLGAGNLKDPTGSPQNNPAPMPATWLYILKDGTTLSPDASSSSGTTVKFLGSILPTSLNPITGRIAFWADDETAKVNLNTASEGTFWDYPKSNSETALNNNMPARDEFQRFPGHPAMTCLSTILQTVGSKWNAANGRASIMALVPRIQDGGSMGGNTHPDLKHPILLDGDRLFASVDELAFTTHYGGSYGAQAPTRTVDPDFTNSQIEKLRFFLTTASRAPEVNLFNQPRICLWPLQANTNAPTMPEQAANRTAKDQMIAFCSATGTGNNYKPYYFQRYNIYFGQYAAFHDGRKDYANPVPSSQSTWEDFALSSSSATANPGNRNQVLFNYLQYLTSLNVPGFGGSLQAKYDSGLPGSAGSERDQILTEMYDMIRTGVNTYDTATNTDPPQYDYAPTRQGGPAAGETQLVPTVINCGMAKATIPSAKGWVNTETRQPTVTKGFGRFMTVPEVAVVFYNTTPTNPDKTKSPANAQIKAALLMDYFNPSPGMASWSPNVRYVITGLGPWKLGDTSGNAQTLGFPDDTGTGAPFNWTTARVGYVDGNHCTAMMGLMAALHRFPDGNDPPATAGDSGDPGKIVGNNNTEYQYPFVTQNNGASVANPDSPKTQKPQYMYFSGGKITVKIYAGYEKLSGAPAQLVQTLHFNFPEITQLPVPTYTGKPNFQDRMFQGKPSTLIDSNNDVVRSVIFPSDTPSRGYATGGSVSKPNAAQGDMRILAAMDVVPEQAFTPHPYYNDKTQRLAFSLRDPEFISNAPTPVQPRLVAGVDWSGPPIVPIGQTRAENTAGVGDFDNAMGGIQDGPYINKPDEGNYNTGGGAWINNTGFFIVEDGASYSPNRQVSSAIMFGSLPSGVKATEAAIYGNTLQGGKPWQTLLFCPNPAAGASHFGFGQSVSTPHTPPYKTPPDHLWLDLFTMPIVEPYPISEPFSTAGKVNLNYQIAPFTHITRSTGVRAVLKSTQIMAIKTGDPDKSGGARYKIAVNASGGGDGGTLTGFQNIFNRGDIFRSASQICDIFLVPDLGGGTGPSYSGMSSWWNAELHTGDNVREFPYGHIYPRVTTKSNTFTVHMRVQTLRKANINDAKTAGFWDEARDKVLGEYRGFTTIERYVDSADPNLPDFANVTAPAAGSAPPSLDQYYKFRTVTTKQFNP